MNRFCSFSEIKCWKECSYRHKLMHIDKVDMFEPSPFLDFGTAVHEGCETYLKSKTIDKEKLLNQRPVQLNQILLNQLVVVSYHLLPQLL